MLGLLVAAAAVDHGHMVHYLDDLLTAGGNVRLVERGVHPDEIGKLPSDIKPDLLVRLYRNSSMLSLWELEQAGRLQAGDILVLLSPTR